MSTAYSTVGGSRETVSVPGCERPSAAGASVLGVSEGRVQHSVRKMESSSHTGLQIGDRIMMFSKDGMRHRDSFTIDIGHFDEGVKVLIMDVNAGVWEVLGEKSCERLSVSKEGGYLFFKAESGTYEMSFITG